MNVALRINAQGLVCRAYRHLAGLCLKQGDIDKAHLQAQAAEDALRRVDDPFERAELDAGLVYQKARELQVRGDLAAALPALVSAQELFGTLADRDRALKVYGPIGQVHLEMGNLAAAKDAFRHGLATARLSSRRDCELVSLVGLAEVARVEENFAEERELLLEASAVALLLGDQSKAAKFETRAKKLSS